MSNVNAKEFIDGYSGFYFGKNNDFETYGIPHNLKPTDEDLEKYIVKNKLKEGIYDAEAFAWKAGRAEWKNGKFKFQDGMTERMINGNGGEIKKKRKDDILKKKSTEYMCEDPENFVAEFECVSERLQSQHFLTLIHSNAAWEADPVNIFQFIISAYVLPGFVNKDSLVKMPREKLVRDNAKGKRYLLDSIHFHSDIYFDVKELQHNMGKLFFELLID